MPFQKLDREFMARFQNHRPALEKVIKRYLPGNFSKWEEERSNWNGPVKTINMTVSDPRASTCAFNIFVANSLGEEALGFANKQSDLNALIDLERALRSATKSLESLSLNASFQLHENSRVAFNSFGSLPPILLLAPLTNALLQAITTTRTNVEKEGSDNHRQNRVAAAVVKVCTEVYETRSGKKAPKTVNDSIYGKENAVLFVKFTNGIFEVLGIDMRVDSSLRLLKMISR